MDEEHVIAEELFRNGELALDDNDCFEASNLLSQSLELTSRKHGENSVEAASICVKYAAALLGCARARENVIGKLGKISEVGQDGASTSTAAAARAEQAAEVAEGEEDLKLAWEVAELARIVFERERGSDSRVTAGLLAEVQELLGDLGTEQEDVQAAVNDYDKALEYLDMADEADLRWTAEVHFKISRPLEFMGEVEQARKHVNLACSQIKYVLKQKEAEVDELSAEGASACLSGSALIPSELNGADNDGSERGAQEIRSARGDDLDGGIGVEEERGTGAEEDDLSLLKAEVLELRGVLKELKERVEDLKDVKQQEAWVKSQLKEQFSSALGDTAGGAEAAFPRGDGTSTSQTVIGSANAIAADTTGDVVDLGTKRGKDRNGQEEPGQDAPVNWATKAAPSQAAKRRRVQPTSEAEEAAARPS